MVTVTDVREVARARMWGWLGGFLVKLIGVVAFCAITWLVGDGDPLHVADILPDGAWSGIAEWFPAAVAICGGWLVARCCWGVAALLARGSRVAAAVAGALAMAGVTVVAMWDYTTAELSLIHI